MNFPLQGAFVIIIETIIRLFDVVADSVFFYLYSHLYIMLRRLFSVLRTAVLRLIFTSLVHKKVIHSLKLMINLAILVPWSFELFEAQVKSIQVKTLENILRTSKIRDDNLKNFMITYQMYIKREDYSGRSGWI